MSRYRKTPARTGWQNTVFAYLGQRSQSSPYIFKVSGPGPIHEHQLYDIMREAREAFGMKSTNIIVVHGDDIYYTEYNIDIARELARAAGSYTGCPTIREESAERITLGIRTKYAIGSCDVDFNHEMVPYVGARVHFSM